MVNFFRLPFRGSKGDASEDARVRLAKKGDRQAFDMLVQTYHAELRQFLRRRVAEVDLEDVLQETWLAAWTALPSFDRRSRFKTWLYALSLNKCKDYHRSLKRVIQPQEELVMAAASDEDIQKRTEDKDTALGVLAALTPSQREVLELYYFAELNLPEISKVLGRNLNTVKYQFYRAHVQASGHLHEGDTEYGEQGARSCG